MNENKISAPVKKFKELKKKMMRLLKS